MLLDASRPDFESRQIGGPQDLHRRELKANSEVAAPGSDFTGEAEPGCAVSCSFISVRISKILA
jgi:hypothetical protein